MVRISFKSYCAISIILTSVVVYRAYEKYQQFYLTGLYLATAKHALLIFTNLVAVLGYLLGKFLVYIFLDRIHERELDLLNDKVKSSLTDTILALTVFREHFNTQFMFLLLFLLFFQVFHWLAKYRVEYLEHSPYELKKIVKLFTLLTILGLADSIFLFFGTSTLINDGLPNIMVLFCLEFGLLYVTGLTTFIQLFINIEGIKREGRWDNKGLYLLYLEFFSEGLKTLLYACFFTVTIINYGIPIHIIRQVFISFRTFCRRLQDILQYQNIMNERFPDATEEELENTDKICIVCREDMLNGKKLPCGHILHLHCLRSWLERQQTCPICRANVIIYDPNQQQNLSILQRLFGRRPPPPPPVAQQAQQPQQQQPQPQQQQPQQQQVQQPQQQAVQPQPPIDNPPPPVFTHNYPRRLHMPVNVVPAHLLQHNVHHHGHHTHSPFTNNPQQTHIVHNISSPSPSSPSNGPFIFTPNTPSSTSTATTAIFSPPPIPTEATVHHIEQIQNHISYLYQQMELLKKHINSNNLQNANNNNNNNNNNNGEKVTDKIFESIFKKPTSPSTATTTSTTTTSTATTQKEDKLILEKEQEEKEKEEITKTTTEISPTTAVVDNDYSHNDQLRQRLARFANLKKQQEGKNNDTVDDSGY